ncbi:hypothetical protein [Embleya sp. NPDC001921]
MGWRTRCRACRATSPPVYSLTDLDAVRQRHRDQAHGGLIPDAGEETIEPESLLTSLSHVPRGQLITAAVILVVIVVAIWLG